MNDFDISELTEKDQLEYLEKSVFGDLCKAMKVSPEKYQGDLVYCILDAVLLIDNLKKLSEHALDLECISGEISSSMTCNDLRREMFNETDNILKVKKEIDGMNDNFFKD